MKISFAATRRKAVSAVLSAAALLAACGGGEPIERFVAKRLIVLGDETSALESDGRKYSVNGFNTADAPDCKVNPLWVQILSGVYNLSFAECPNGSGVPVTALMFATPGATVSSIPGQIDAVGGFVDKDLVTLLAGANDILAQYALVVSGTAESQAAAALKVAGEALAGQVNRIANSGGKVLISTVPDLGLTPFALSENATSSGRAALLTRLTKSFNDNLRNKIINDGRRIGLLLTDELVQAVVRNPAGAGLVDVTRAVCDPAFLPPACTTKTLVTPPGAAASASASTYLWANDRLFSSSGQSLLGSQAASRASGNPF